ncbi:hypothetical protein Tsubulata_028446 [Turnera subulata]|uniref:Uncharacterized protein n=1 Tax=Turnera subulata TaxID=218843 RepID=A0A9Q0F1D8_9ROSI|nr:hypothetical protein Tsubulata_028446 [Turnera subulata]
MVPSVNPSRFGPVIPHKTKSPSTNPKAPCNEELQDCSFIAWQIAYNVWKKEMTAAQEVPPGYDPVPETKPKTKAVKRNERKKEKRLQAALEKGKNSEAIADGDTNKGEVLTAESLDHASKSVASLTSQMNELAVTPNSVLVSPPAENAEVSESGVTFQDIDKKIRAIKKKIRLAEGQIQKTSAQDMKPEQLEKITKLEGWREELKLLESKKAEQAASS